MELSTWERLRLLSLLPQKGTFVTMKVVHKLQQSLSFTEKEIADLQFREDGDRMMWNPDVDKPNHHLVTPKPSDDEMAAIIEDLMAREPKRSP